MSFGGFPHQDPRFQTAYYTTGYVVPPQMAPDHRSIYSGHAASEYDYRDNFTSRSSRSHPDRPGSPKQAQNAADLVEEGAEELQAIIARRRETTGPIRADREKFQAEITKAETDTKTLLKKDLRYLKEHVFHAGMLPSREKDDYNAYKRQLQDSQNTKLRTRPPAPPTPEPLKTERGKQTIASIANYNNPNLKRTRFC